MFLSRNKKNNVYPCKPQFYYIKVGFKGVTIIYACFHDGVFFFLFFFLFFLCFLFFFFFFLNQNVNICHTSPRKHAMWYSLEVSH